VSLQLGQRMGENDDFRSKLTLRRSPVEASFEDMMVMLGAQFKRSVSSVGAVKVDEGDGYSCEQCMSSRTEGSEESGVMGYKGQGGR
jgi:hypothetical protein